MVLDSNNILKEFRDRFGSEPIVVESPARVNLIGEHTDYNDGFVMPAAIDKRLVLAMAPNSLNRIRLFASDMNHPEFETGLEGDFQKTKLGWPNYILGVVDQLYQRGYDIEGFDCVFGGDIPIGAGLSSSAALEGGILLGLSELFDLYLDRMEMARIGQQAENQFVGVQCGIMDQFANLHGKSRNVIKLDCRTLDYSHHSFDSEEVAILLCDTTIRRELAKSEYNIRRQQCERGVEILRQFDDTLKNLRDVSHQFLEEHKYKLTEVIYNRCRYVLDENQRVLDACDDLENGDINSFGQRMYHSHYGLKNQYEVSCRELDLLVESTENNDAVIGSRMMGGGFGGCTINLVQENEMDDVIECIRNRYEESMNAPLEFHQAHISEGTTVMKRIMK